jgi:hypothetical protein
MTVRLKADVSRCDTDHSVVVLNERTGQYWQLNETGAGVLTAALNGATSAEIANRFASVRPVRQDRALADVQSLLDNLAAADLIERA